MGPTARCPQVPLAAYTTLGLGDPAATLAEPTGEPGPVSAVRGADDRGEPVLVIVEHDARGFIMILKSCGETQDRGAAGSWITAACR